MFGGSVRRGSPGSKSPKFIIVNLAWRAHGARASNFTASHPRRASLLCTGVLGGAAADMGRLLGQLDGLRNVSPCQGAAKLWLATPFHAYFLPGSGSDTPPILSDSITELLALAPALSESNFKVLVSRTRTHSKES